jgi:hypothetical protein
MHQQPWTNFSAPKNALASLVTQSHRQSDAIPLLHSLLWLLMRQCITYELALLPFKTTFFSSLPT